MADILALVLKHNSARPLDLNNLSFTSGTGWNTSSCIIVGESCDIKTSLLFLAAVTAASELGVKVLFLTPTPIQKLPGPLQDSLANLNPDGLKKIRFMYPRSQEELLQDLASLHETACGPAAPPSLLIVDGLERYLGAGPWAGPGSCPQGDAQLAAAHISALLADTASFLSRKLEERGGACAPCRVIASFDTERQGHSAGELAAPDPVLSILDRYFPVRCTLERDSPERDWSTAPAGIAGELRTAWQVYFSGVAVTASHAARKGEGHSARTGEGHSARTGEGHSARTGEGHSARMGEGHSARTGEGHSARTGEGHSARTGEGHSARTGEGQILGRQWRLAVQQNGAMEFSLIGSENQAKQ